MDLLRARSVNEILGKAPLAGLSELPAPHNLPVPFAELGDIVATQVQAALNTPSKQDIERATSQEQKDQLIHAFEHGTAASGSFMPEGIDGWIAQATDEDVKDLLISARESGLAEFARYMPQGIDGWIDAIREQIEIVYPTQSIVDKHLAEFDLEVENMKATLEGAGLRRPNLDTRERQLLWTAGLFQRQLEGKLHDPLHRDPVGRAVMDSDYVYAMLMDFGLSAGVSAKVVLGKGGSWFGYSPSTGIITIDLIFTLIAGGVRLPSGLVHAHANVIFHHEKGHDLHSHSYPSAMQAIWQEMRELHYKGGEQVPALGSVDADDTLPTYDNSQSKLTADEYKRLKHLDAEWQLRHGIFNSAEDNCVNRYAVDLTKAGLVRQHMGDSLNVFSVLTNGLGKKRKEPIKDTPSGRLRHLGHTINMCFFNGNEAAPDTDAGWEQLKVNREWIENFTNPGKNPREDFETLRALAHSLEKDQPYLSDRNILGKFGLQPVEGLDELHARAEAVKAENPYLSKALLAQWETLCLSEVSGYDHWCQYWSVRRARTVDKIFEQYADPLIEKLMEEIRKNINQQVDQKLQQAKQKGQSQGQGDGEGEGQGQPGQGQGQPGQGQPGQGQGQPGQGQPGQGGQGMPGQGGSGGGKGDGLRVEGLGDDTPAEPLPGATPGETRAGEKEAREGKSAEERAADGEGAPTTDQLRRDAIDGKTGGPLASAKPDITRSSAPRQAPKNLPKPTAKPANGKGTERSPFDDINLGDGRLYSELQYSPEYLTAVKNVARWFRKISERMQQYDTRVSPQVHSLIPLGGDFQRLAQGRVDQLMQRMSEGKAKIEDFELFKENQLYVHPTLGDIQFLIDGSGSMAGERLEIGAKLAALVRDAGSISGYQAFGTIWGDHKPWIIFNPDMKRPEMASRIDGVKEGKSSGTCLAPAIPDILARLLASKKHRDKKHGFSHIVIPTDGGISDEQETFEALDTYLGTLKSATLDVIFLQENDGSFRKVLNRLPARHKIGIYSIDDVADIPRTFAELMQNRLRLCAHKAEAIKEEEWRSKVRRTYDSVETSIQRS